MNITHGGNVFEISREHGWDWRDVLDFSASVNPLGPAPKVAEAIRSAIDRISHYPEREPTRLRRAVRTLWGLDQDQILLGNGATELIHFFARIEKPKKVTLAVPVFSEFHRAYSAAEFVATDTPEKWPREGLLVLTQPINPTGQALCPDALERWLMETANPVLIDESFIEFTGIASTIRLVETRPKLYVLRSLTKFYALPGLRVGALVASRETLVRWRPMREPWQVNVLAEEAALAAIADAGHARRTLEFIAHEKDWLFTQVSRLVGAHPVPSHANYMMIRLGYLASGLYAHMLENRILIRDCTGMPGIEGSAVRIAIRPRAENERLLRCWKGFSCEP